MRNYILMALLATLGTWFVTALGAGTVVFFKKPKEKILNLMLGFSAGVMIAASFWSLLQPAIDRADALDSKIPSYLSVTIGFILGAIFLLISDKIVSKEISGTNKSANEKSGKNRMFMLILSITLHNIPEGLAVGVAFGALKNANASPEQIMGAFSIAIGIALQNFPEGAAVSIPLRREGKSRFKSFIIGQASGLVEPVAGIIGAALVVYVNAILPYALSFAAGAMILVAVHELIPECQQNREEMPYFSTLGIIAGFAVMMLLDVALG